MNKKSGMFIIFMIFALPILLYFVTKGPADSQTLSIADAQAANKPKVLHFSQVMCSECRELEKVMNPVEQEYKNKINFVNIDVSQGTTQTQALMRKYNVRVVPTLVFINKNGTVTDRTEGSMPKEKLEEYLNKICN